ncbi:MAG: sulfurtransferase [Burkholderiales bacterium]|nr:sulfurtransferase [Burkholderiales bacterium]MDE2397831.1 sulfurtransferase [Burkholderiales bacterium]
MTHHPLVTAEELRALPRLPLLLDCSFELSEPAAGERAHALGHLPGALYAHLDRDLAGPRTGRNGRHPLPEFAVFAATAGRWGIAPGVRVVTYDAQGGPYAARAWWMLRWLGHDDVAVLDGGIEAWRRAGGAIETGAVAAQPLAPYPAQAPAMPTIEADALLAALGRVRIVDARGGDRFRGETEPLDAVAGHIPGATNRFFKDNLQADGRFKPADQLRAEFEAWGTAAAGIVHQCGSGVTACHNLLAMSQAGLEGSRLYPGSWSEWCCDPARPVARG